MKLLDHLQESFKAPESPYVDPCLAAPVIHGCDYARFDSYMTDLHQEWSKTWREKHGDEYEIRPVALASEPPLSVTAGWGEFWDEPTKSSRLSAMECMDQIAAMKKPRQ